MPSEYTRKGSHYYLPARPCAECGVQFEPRVDARATTRGLYCGRSCANRAGRLTRARRRGEQNPNWVGGTSYATHLRVSKKRWLKFRREYLGAHPNICELCGVPARTMHHRIPVREWPDGEFVESNIQVLCKPCHARVENALRQQARNGTPD